MFILIFFAERMGFEPMKRFWRLHTFQACAIDQLGHLSSFLPNQLPKKQSFQRANVQFFFYTKIFFFLIKIYIVISPRIDFLNKSTILVVTLSIPNKYISLATADSVVISYPPITPISCNFFPVSYFSI